MSNRWPLKIVLAFAAAVPAVVVRLAGFEVGAFPSVVVSGAAIVASAFLLAWAAEAAQADISASLATALLALIAVLPEYAVDLYFAWVSGHRPEMGQYAAANMTGSNRLLIGLGWPLVVLICAWGARRRRERWSQVELEPRNRVELAFLAIAGVFSFVIPITHRISLLDAAVLLGLFAAYMWRVSREERHEPDLVGVAERIAALPASHRRAVVVGLFVAASSFILAAAEPFANSLVAAGRQLGIDEFLLVQWLAPLASEAPELLVAAFLAWRGAGGPAIGMLLSSKVNQWTLLVGSLPVAHFVGRGGTALPLDARQVEEFYLTAAQTALGFAVLANLRFSVTEALALLSLFALQFPFPGREIRLIFSGAYVLLALALLMRGRRFLPAVIGALRPASVSTAALRQATAEPRRVR
jgi:cation:H+ antiporter